MADHINETEEIPAGWHIGDVRPCGCEFGVPGVWHDRNDACTGEDY